MLNNRNFSGKLGTLNNIESSYLASLPVKQPVSSRVHNLNSGNAKHRSSIRQLMSRDASEKGGSVVRLPRADIASKLIMTGGANSPNGAIASGRSQASNFAPNSRFNRNQS